MLSLVLYILMLLDRTLLPVPETVRPDYSQPPPQLPVEVELLSPPPGQMYVEDLWKVRLYNSTTEVFSVYLFVTIEKAGYGLMMDATTAVFLLPPGPLTVSSAELSPVNAEFYDSNFETSVSSMGGFPDGDYTVTIYVYEENGGLLGTSGFTQHVENHSAPELQYPSNCSEVSDPLPVFTWFPSYPPGIVEYTLRIVEILEGQSPESAIFANPAWFLAENLQNREIAYPVYADCFVYGQSYAWQVEGFYEGNSTGGSEVWSFSCVNPGMPGEEGSEKWSFETGSRVSCSPAIAMDGSILCGGIDGFVYSIDPLGNELWRYPAGGPVYSVAVGPDGRIFASGESGLCSVDPSGFLIWYNGNTGPVDACPLILPSGRLYAGSVEGVFYSIDALSGEILDTLKTDGSIVLPAAADSAGTVYFTSNDKYLYALDDDSEFSLKWKFGVDENFTGGPVISRNNIYAAAGKNVYCFNRSGLQMWSSGLPSQVYSGPVVASDGTVYAGTGSGNIYALEGETGMRTGVIPAGALVTSTPALNITGALFFGCDDGYLHCFSPSGFSLWDFRTGGIIRSSSVIGIDGTVYFGSDDHNIYAISGSGAGPMLDGWPQYCRNSFNNGYAVPSGEKN